MCLRNRRGCFFPTVEGVIEHIQRSHGSGLNHPPPHFGDREGGVYPTIRLLKPGGPGVRGTSRWTTRRPSSGSWATLPRAPQRPLPHSGGVGGGICIRVQGTSLSGMAPINSLCLNDAVGLRQPQPPPPPPLAPGWGSPSWRLCSRTRPRRRRPARSAIAGRRSLDQDIPSGGGHLLKNPPPPGGIASPRAG